MNKILFLLIFVKGICSCSNCYKYIEKESYLIQKRNSFYQYTPKYVYYESHYDSTNSYSKKVVNQYRGEKIRFNGVKDSKLVYHIKKLDSNLILPLVIGDTIENSFCLPMMFFNNSTTNMCNIKKYLSQTIDVYQYHYVKDTLIATNLGVQECVLNNVVLVDETNFFREYPLKIYIDKRNGIPLEVHYPSCNDEESLSVEYHKTYLLQVKKFFLLNKQYLW